MNYSDFVNGIKEIKKTLQNQFPYNINLIDELHADENAHTRILLKLLEYKSGESRVILKMFISLLNQHLSEQYQISFNNIDNSKIWGQYKLIDGLLYFENEGAIIIENKIQWATDQDEQIQRYIDYVKELNLQNHQIYVVYLTDDGRKKVSDLSLTDKAKAILNYKNDDKGRYIEINYKDDILPILKDVLKCLDFSQEVYLKSTVIQYIDYLEGRFGLRSRERKYNESFKSELLKFFDIDVSKLKTVSENNRTVNEINILYKTFYEQLRNDEENRILISELTKQINYLCLSIYPEDIRPSTVKRNLVDFLNTTLSDYFKNPAKIKWESWPDWIIVTGKDWIMDLGFEDTEKIQINITPINNNRLKEYLKMKNYSPLNACKLGMTLSYEEHYQSINTEIECLITDISSLNQ